MVGIIVLTQAGGDGGGDDGDVTVITGPPRDVASIAYEWIGYDGTTWDLVDPAGYVSKVRGSSGWGFSDVTHWWDDAAAIDGSFWQGSRTERGSLFLPLELRGRDSAHYIANKRSFMRTLDPEQVGTMVVRTPDNRVRRGECRYVSGADAEVNIDPVRSLGSRYGITWALAAPYWRGEDVIVTYDVEDPPPFFAPADNSPRPAGVFNIATDDSIALGQVTNPGDVKSYPKWRVDGPFTAFQVGIGDSLIAMTVTKAAGHWIEIDTDPRVLTIVDDLGADHWDDVTDATFAPIPPGEEIPLALDLTGTGSITLTFPTNYRAAW